MTDYKWVWKLQLINEDQGLEGISNFESGKVIAIYGMAKKTRSISRKFNLKGTVHNLLHYFFLKLMSKHSNSMKLAMNWNHWKREQETVEQKVSILFPVTFLT